MSDLRERFPFTSRLIAGAPDEPGVFVLWQDREIIFIGHTQGRGETIRSALVEHFAGNASPSTRRATHYSWMITRSPAALEAQLLEEYNKANSRLPWCNTAR